jgi:hypothetical protein
MILKRRRYVSKYTSKLADLATRKPLLYRDLLALFRSQLHHFNRSSY